MREFVCAACGRQVVVNPELPLTFIPTFCALCWDVRAPKRNTKE